MPDPSKAAVVRLRPAHELMLGPRVTASCLRMARIACVLALVPSLAAAAERWPDSEWNPHQMPDDFVLPLPCNGAIAFRPVPTPAGAGALADRPAMLGESDPESDYKEYLRQAYVLGAIPSTNPNEPRRYYMAKYEVTLDQFAAVMQPSCPALPTPRGRLPQADISWLQAVEFTSRLTEWLMQHAKDALPKYAEATAFVRLPTEDEWEFAARGGAAVSEADFGARTFPMADDMRRYVWFQGSRSSGNRVNPIGRLEPNPLGLFDILGNVSEWALDPYRLNKVGRPHGQAGGEVVRGGDYRTDESRIRSSLREEVPPFAPDGQPTRSSSIGFRPVLAMVAEYDDQRATQLREAFQKEVDASGTAANDPRKLLTKLRDDASDPTLKEGIARIEGALNAEVRARTDQEGQTIRAQMEAAGFIGRQIIIVNNIGRILSMLANNQGNLLASQAELADEQMNLARLARDEVKAALIRLSERTRQSDHPIRTTQDGLMLAADTQKQRIRDLVSAYLGIVLSVGRSAAVPRIADEGKVVLQQIQARPSLPLLPEVIQTSVRHMSATSGGRPPSSDQVLQDLLTLASQPAPSGAGGAGPGNSGAGGSASQGTGSAGAAPVSGAPPRASSPSPSRQGTPR